MVQRTFGAAAGATAAPPGLRPLRPQSLAVPVAIDPSDRLRDAITYCKTAFETQSDAR